MGEFSRKQFTVQFGSKFLSNWSRGELDSSNCLIQRGPILGIRKDQLLILPIFWVECITCILKFKKSEGKSNIYWDRARCLVYMISFKPLKSPMSWSTFFYRLENWYTDRLSNQPKVTLLVRGGAKIQIQSALSSPSVDGFFKASFIVAEETCSVLILTSVKNQGPQNSIFIYLFHNDSLNAYYFPGISREGKLIQPRHSHCSCISKLSS